MAARTGPKALRRAETESFEPQVAGREILLGAVGVGVLENLGEEVERQQAEEAAKAKAQQKEAEGRAQMLRKLERLKRAARAARLSGSTLE